MQELAGSGQLELQPPMSTPSLQTPGPPPSSPNSRLQDAVRAVPDSGVKADGSPVLSYRKAAKHYQVERNKLRCQCTGGLDRSEAHTTQMLIPPGAEDALEGFVKVEGAQGVPMTAMVLGDKVEKLCG